MDWRTPGAGLRIGGHRGAAGDAPENTLAGFALALAAGADYVELDVQLSRDGVLVVFHDETLDRTTDGHGRLTDHVLADLLRLDGGAWFSAAHEGARIMTLEGFLDWLAGESLLGATIEAKGPGTGAPVARLALAHPAAGRLSICSFSAAELAAAAEAAPAVPRLLIVDRDDPGADPVALARSARATGVNVPWDWLDPAAVARLHAAGLFVAGGTLNDPARVRECLGLGLDAVDSDHPGAIVAARDAARGDALTPDAGAS